MQQQGADMELGEGPAQRARLSIREDLAESIPGLIERDRFLNRIVQLVARYSRQELVAVYTIGMAGGDFILRAGTLPHSSPPPARISIEPNTGASVISTAATGNAVLVAPLREEDDLIGALVVFQPHGGFSAADQALVEALAEEVAPAVAVAERHHVVKQHSVLDPASGAYTNWFLNQRLDEEIERARRQGREVTVVLLNLDGAERIWPTTDVLGGATLPRDLTNVLASSTRKFDVVAQRAPGEFAIMLVDSDAGDAVTVVERIRTRMEHAISRALPGETGVAVATSHASYPLDGEDATSLVLAAEHRLDDALRRQWRPSGR